MRKCTPLGLATLLLAFSAGAAAWHLLQPLLLCANKSKSDHDHEQDKDKDLNDHDTYHHNDQLGHDLSLYQPDPALRINIDNLAFIRKLQRQHPDMRVFPFRPSSDLKGNSHGTSLVEDKTAYVNNFIRGPTLYGKGRIEYAKSLLKDEVLIKVCCLGKRLCGHDGAFPSLFFRLVL